VKKNILIFDLDGTLIKSKKDIIESFNLALKKYQIKINDSFFLKNSSLGSFYFLKKIFPSDKKKLNIALDNFRKIYYKNCTKNTKLTPGVKKFLKWTVNNNYINVISTNKSLKLSVKILKYFDLLNYFKKIYAFDNSNFKKPNKKHLENIISDFKAIPKKTFYFGDSHVDSKMSLSCGVKFILLKNGYTNLAQSKIYKNKLIKDFNEININSF
jgi:phosphoglycolate phosphatase-like HAD superfamily hydrolase